MMLEQSSVHTTLRAGVDALRNVSQPALLGTNLLNQEIMKGMATNPLTRTRRLPRKRKARRNQPESIAELDLLELWWSCHRKCERDKWESPRLEHRGGSCTLRFVMSKDMTQKTTCCMSLLSMESSPFQGQTHTVSASRKL